MKYSRSQFYERVGLSRKALRIYEGKGLLSPVITSNDRAFFSEPDVARATLIKKLRGAGVAIDQIENLLASGSENVADAGVLIRSEILNRINVANAALREMDHYIKHVKHQPEWVRFGGFWAYGRGCHLKKNNVTDFVRNFARDVETLQKKNKIIAFYSNEKNSSVDLACYVEDLDKSDFSTLNLRKNFLTQEARCALKTKGFVGEYECFDKDYEVLVEFRGACPNLKLRNQASIEIYHDYPTSSNRSVFDAQILV